jgi:uncharacterized protein
MRTLRVFLLLCGMTAPVSGQTTITPGSIQSTGSASVAAMPDQAQFTVSVVTQAATAQDAGSQNATQATALIAALKSAIGNNGNVQTIGYSISPRYNNNGTSITGYTATNTVQVTTFSLSNVGGLIDVATQSGGSSISGISFGLQNPDPFVQQALGLASQQALAHANAIAGGLGVKTAGVMSAQEGSTYSPIVSTPTAGATSTPVVTGTVQVTATVTVVVRLTQ